MPGDKNTILILGARAPIALELARSFHAHNWQVIMVDAQHWTLARWSRSVAHYEVVPPPAFELEPFKNKIISIIKKYNVKYCLPNCEEVFYISKIKNELPCKVWTMEIEVMDLLHNKLKFSEYAKNYFNVPQTIPASEFVDWKNTSEYVFKPVYSRFASETLIRPSQEKVQAAMEQPKDWIAQEFIKGKEICVYSIFDEGVLKGFAAYHPLYRYGQGSGIYFQSVFNEIILKQVEYFGLKLNYTGQLCFDFIIKNEIPFVLECNPRGTSGAHLIGEELATCFLGGSPIILRETVSPKAIKFALWIEYPEMVFSKTYKKAEDVIYKKNDVLPLLLQPLSLLELFYLKFKKRKSLLKVMTEDIEWNGD